MKIFVPLTLAAAMLMAGCNVATKPASEANVSVSIPVISYFAQRLGGDSLHVNVLVPQSVGHSDYTPRPSQMMALSASAAYLAIGNLDFEATWRERMLAASPDMQWLVLTQDMHLLQGECSHHHSAGHHHHTDPHVWLSPKQCLTLADNMAEHLNRIFPQWGSRIDTALVALKADISAFDARFRALAADSLAFMIYHPSLTYLAADYGMTQFAIEKGGSAPTAQTYMNEIASARARGVKVVFVQQGYDMDKARSAAQMLGAQVVEFSPEDYDWPATMQTLLSALEQCK